MTNEIHASFEAAYHNFPWGKHRASEEADVDFEAFKGWMRVKATSHEGTSLSDFFELWHNLGIIEQIALYATFKDAIAEVFQNAPALVAAWNRRPTAPQVEVAREVGELMEKWTMVNRSDPKTVDEFAYKAGWFLSANAPAISAAVANGEIVRTMLSALHFAEGRYRSMWFGLGHKPVTTTRLEWEAIKGAIAAAQAALATKEQP